MRPVQASTAALAGLALAALAFGTVVGWIDSRPGWDDTGVTAGLLAIGAAFVTAVAGRRPWLWALLIGAPLPIIELAGAGAWASLAAIVFAAVGASLGLLIRRVLREGQRAT
jgi:hypothetical protein